MKKIAVIGIIISTILLLSSCNGEQNKKDIVEKQPTVENVKKMEDMGLTLEEVAKHSSSSDCYTAIDGKVYDVTSFFGKHPGGDSNLAKTCGIDSTELFNNKHGKNEKAKMKKEEFLIGELK